MEFLLAPYILDALHVGHADKVADPTEEDRTLDGERERVDMLCGSLKEDIVVVSVLGGRRRDELKEVAGRLASRRKSTTLEREDRALTASGKVL